MPLRSRITRPLLSLGFALAIGSVPLAQVAACSCAMSTTEQAIGAAELAFVGTVADQRDAGVRNDVGETLREYAFVVDRANAATDPVTVVLAGTGGASCGMTFANGEQWLILSHRGPAGLETSLCSGNVLLADIAPLDRAVIDDLLPTVPTEKGAEPEPTTQIAVPPVPFLVAGAALALLGAVAFLAFRGGRS